MNEKVITFATIGHKESYYSKLKRIRSLTNCSNEELNDINKACGIISEQTSYSYMETIEFVKILLENYEHIRLNNYYKRLKNAEFLSDNNYFPDIDYRPYKIEIILTLDYMSPYAIYLQFEQIPEEIKTLLKYIKYPYCNFNKEKEQLQDIINYLHNEVSLMRYKSITTELIKLYESDFMKSNKDVKFKLNSWQQKTYDEIIENKVVLNTNTISRQSGKSVLCLYIAHEKGYSIIVPNLTMKQHLLNKAKKLGFRDEDDNYGVEIYTIDEIKYTPTTPTVILDEIIFSNENLTKLKDSSIMNVVGFMNYETTVIPNVFTYLINGNIKENMLDDNMINILINNNEKGDEMAIDFTNISNFKLRCNGHVIGTFINPTLEIEFENENKGEDEDMNSNTKYEVCEDLDNYKVIIALAGYDKDDVDLHIKNDTLYVKLNNNENYKEGCYISNEKYDIIESNLELNDLEIEFEDHIDNSSIDAKMSNGLLEITIPKLRKSNKIKIKGE